MIWFWLAFILALAASLRYMTHMPGSSHAGPLPPLSGAQAELRDRLARHVAVLAGLARVTADLAQSQDTR